MLNIPAPVIKLSVNDYVCTDILPKNNISAAKSAGVKPKTDGVSECNTMDSELAMQAGRQMAGMLPPPGNGWKWERPHF